MIKINRLEIENVKRIRAVKIEPSASGLTVIGGRNNQGKTSVLDSIAWALGGDKYRPSSPEREGSVIAPKLHIVLSNGLVVERSGKNSDLKVIDGSGKKGGQQLLNEFIGQLALDLPKFMQSTSKEKADILLQIIGVGDKLFELEKEENDLYNRRRTIGQIADQKSKFAKEMQRFEGVPKDIISAGELINQQQRILAQNGENQRKRESLRQILDKVETLQKQLNIALADLEIAEKSALDLHDESTAELEENINKIDELNRKIRANLDEEKAEDDAKDYSAQYADLSNKIDDIRLKKSALLEGADLPLAGLSVQDGELIFGGFKWDNMSASEQLKVGAAIVRKLKPECGFVLLDKLEQMDLETLSDFGNWLEGEGLQAIATRVSVGDECSIIIEDGYSEEHSVPQAQAKTWEAGRF